MHPCSNKVEDRLPAHFLFHERAPFTAHLLCRHQTALVFQCLNSELRDNPGPEPVCERGRTLLASFPAKKERLVASNIFEAAVAHSVGATFEERVATHPKYLSNCPHTRHLPSDRFRGGVAPPPRRPPRSWPPLSPAAGGHWPSIGGGKAPRLPRGLGGAPGASAGKERKREKPSSSPPTPALHHECRHGGGGAGGSGPTVVAAVRRRRGGGGAAARSLPNGRRSSAAGAGPPPRGRGSAPGLGRAVWVGTAPLSSIPLGGGGVPPRRTAVGAGLRVCSWRHRPAATYRMAGARRFPLSLPPAPLPHSPHLRLHGEEVSRHPPSTCWWVGEEGGGGLLG